MLNLFRIGAKQINIFAGLERVMETPTAVRRYVLCVDSDPALAQAIAAFLPACHTVAADSGYSALREINAKTFDLYVLDYWLPDWSGVQLCRAIRKTDPRAPVFFCTSAGRDEDRKRALRAGANAYLLKPIDAAQFRREARLALELGDLQSQRAEVEGERAVQDELHRLSAIAQTRAVDASAATERALKRTARAKALKAFLESGGTRAHFERWWPQIYNSLDAAGVVERRDGAA